MRHVDSQPLATTTTNGRHAFVLGLAVGAGLLLAGLRLAQGPTEARAQSPVPGSPLAEPPAPEAAGDAPFDLALVPDDAAGLVAIRPSRLLGRPELRTFVDLLRGADGMAEAFQMAALVGLSIDGIDQAMFVQLRPAGAGLEGDPGELAMRAGAAILKTRGPVDARRAASALRVPTSEATYAGRTYQRIVADELIVGVYQPDDHTAIVALEPNLFALMGRMGAPDRDHPWAAAWAEVARHDLAMAGDVGFARGLLGPAIESADEAALMIAPFAPLWEETTAIVIGAKLDGGVALDAVAACGSADGATAVADTVRSVLTLGRNASKSLQGRFQLMAASGDGDDRAALLAYDRLIGLGVDTLRTAQVERRDAVVRLKATAKFDLGDAVRMLMAGL